MAGSSFQYHRANQRAAFGHHVDWKHKGFPPCYNVKETGHAAEDEECGEMDEAKALASGFQAKGPTV